MRHKNTILGSLIALGLTTHLWSLPQDPTFSEPEQGQLAARMDTIHRAWLREPFSLTLALRVPGGKTLLNAAELAQLQALLLMSTPQHDPLEKDRGAYNVIVDQEFSDIWEVRYRRHLLEGFMIWEDRE